MKKCLECKSKDATISFMNGQIASHHRTIAELSYNLRQKEEELTDKDKVLFERNATRYQIVTQIKNLQSSLQQVGEWY